MTDVIECDSDNEQCTYDCYTTEIDVHAHDVNE